jgi:hypothetical protein
MKTIYYLSLFFCFSILMSPGCKKNKDSLENQLSKLPAITQTGQHSFGCLVNGKAWVPKGWDGRKPNLDIIADPGYFGNLDIRAYRYVNNKRESISISSFDITAPGTYIINGINRIWVNYGSEMSNCFFLQDSTNYKNGFLKINKYDFQTGIVSGEFECKLFDSSISCDTIRITNGRFDYKL